MQNNTYFGTNCLFLYNVHVVSCRSECSLAGHGHDDNLDHYYNSGHVPDIQKQSSGHEAPRQAQEA